MSKTELLQQNAHYKKQILDGIKNIQKATCNITVNLQNMDQDMEIAGQVKKDVIPFFEHLLDCTSCYQNDVDKFLENVTNFQKLLQKKSEAIDKCEHLNEWAKEIELGFEAIIKEFKNDKIKNSRKAQIEFNEISILFYDTRKLVTEHNAHIMERNEEAMSLCELVPFLNCAVGGNRESAQEQFLFESWVDKLLDQPTIKITNSANVKLLVKSAEAYLLFLKEMKLDIEVAKDYVTRIIIKKFDKETALQYEEISKKCNKISKPDDVLEFLKQAVEASIDENKKSILDKSVADENKESVDGIKDSNDDNNQNKNATQEEETECSTPTTKCMSSVNIEELLYDELTTSSITTATCQQQQPFFPEFGQQQTPSIARQNSQRKSYEELLESYIAETGNNNLRSVLASIHCLPKDLTYPVINEYLNSYYDGDDHFYCDGLIEGYMRGITAAIAYLHTQETKSLSLNGEMLNECKSDMKTFSQYTKTVQSSIQEILSELKEFKQIYEKSKDTISSEKHEGQNVKLPVGYARLTYGSTFFYVINLCWEFNKIQIVTGHLRDLERVPGLVEWLKSVEIDRLHQFKDMDLEVLGRFFPL